MPEMLFLSERCGSNKTAWICRRRETNDYVTIGYIGGLERIMQIFATEREAEAFAEDWITVITP